MAYCLRTRITAYVSANSYVRMQAWHSSVYPWAYLAFRKRVEFGLHASYTTRADTGEGFLQVRPAIRKAEGGGGGGVLYASGPLSTPVRYKW